jgi:multiple sugar transport system substrate-binding protein
MATMKDVALESRTSIATVSNYLSGIKPVSKALSERIQTAVEKLNYTPNLSARNLKSNQYADIGVILPSFNDPYFVQLFKGIEKTIQNSGFFLNLAFSYDIPELERNIIKTFILKKVTGLILITCQPEEWKYFYRHFVSQDKAMVLIDRNIPDLVTNFISFDYFSAIKRIVTEQLKSGKRSIFLFAGPERFYCEKECINGYISAFESMGIPYDPNNIINTSMNKEDSFRYIVSLLRHHRGVVAARLSYIQRYIAHHAQRGSLERIHPLSFDTIHRASRYHDGHSGRHAAAGTDKIPQGL